MIAVNDGRDSPSAQTFMPKSGTSSEAAAERKASLSVASGAESLGVDY
jgi:hypothetical protein